MFQKLQKQHLPHVEETLRSVGVFSDREVDVCLGIADECLRDPEQEEYFFECLVGEGEKPEGFVVYGEASLAERVWEVYWLAVRPDRQGKGVGRKLMKRAEDAMGAAGARMCFIETSGRAEYMRANAFYQHCGYSEAARIKDFYREGDDLVILRRDFGAR
ncbi:MAG: GNAT family N-acetyltransferase [Planctomycetota bacterium]|jgi:ribosomal protein S18 acetylase RimI-like enzyme